MIRPLWLLVVSALAAASCSRSSGDRADAGTPSKPFPGQPTSALVHRPEVAALVDALAAEHTIESSHVGATAAASPVYAKLQALAAKATPEELAALLAHASPVVRGYVGQHLARHVPTHVGSVVAIADDDTAVDSLNGCMHHVDTVGGVVREALCYSPLVEAGAALVAVHAQGGPQAAAALACAAPTQPVLAGEAAMRALGRADLAPQARAAYLRVLAVAPAPSRASGCEAARAGAASADASVQIGAAMALGRCDDPASIALLDGLAASKNVVVARHASVSLFLLLPGRRAALAGDPHVVYEASDRLRARLKTVEGQRDGLALAETLALAYPSQLGGPFHDAAPSPEATAAARRIAKGLPTALASDYGSAREGAIAYLARVRDRESLPELRRSLGSSHIGELASALEAIGALRDTSAKAAVEKLTHHSEGSVARAARAALAAL